MERLTSPNINVDPGTDRFLHATIGGKEIDWKQSKPTRTKEYLRNRKFMRSKFGIDIQEI